MADPESIPAPQWFSVSGFKSLRNEARVELRPLTVLAGANSSGKSAVMQPLLMLKQTLQSSYDAGPLKLDGPHVSFTELHQLYSYNGSDVLRLAIGPVSRGADPADMCTHAPVALAYARTEGDIHQADVSVFVRQRWISLREDTPSSDAVHACRAFTGVELEFPSGDRPVVGRFGTPLPVLTVSTTVATEYYELDIEGWNTDWLVSVMHIPGLRGPRARVFPVTSTGSSRDLTGDFLPYVASFIARWQDSEPSRLHGLVSDLSLLGVTTGVQASRLNATQLQVTVEDPLQSGRAVDIADVGFGVSQALPVVVALRAAIPGQIVYVEQPELHLHPRAQWQMGRLLCAAAERGIRVVVETHSRLILRAIQTEVAAERLTPGDVGLHWFERDPDDGGTRVRLAELDADGAFGDWPVDFSEVETQADDAWLDEVYGRTG